MTLEIRPALSRTVLPTLLGVAIILLGLWYMTHELSQESPSYLSRARTQGLVGTLIIAGESSPCSRPS